MKPALPLNVEYQRFTKANGGFWKVVDSNGTTLAIVDPGGEFEGAAHLAGVIKTAHSCRPVGKQSSTETPSITATHSRINRK